jgi:hypothetical protein
LKKSTKNNIAKLETIAFANAQDQLIISKTALQPRNIRIVCYHKSTFNLSQEHLQFRRFYIHENAWPRAKKKPLVSPEILCASRKGRKEAIQHASGKIQNARMATKVDIQFQGLVGDSLFLIPTLFILKQVMSHGTNVFKAKVGTFNNRLRWITGKEGVRVMATQHEKQGYFNMKNSTFKAKVSLQRKIRTRTRFVHEFKKRARLSIRRLQYSPVYNPGFRQHKPCRTPWRIERQGLIVAGEG